MKFATVCVVAVCVLAWATANPVLEDDAAVVLANESPSFLANGAPEARCSQCSSNYYCAIFCMNRCGELGYANGGYVVGTCVKCKCWRGAVVNTEIFPDGQ